MIATTEVTRSFGWNTVDAFMQRDVQEFNRLIYFHIKKNLPTYRQHNLKIEG